MPIICINNNNLAFYLRRSLRAKRLQMIARNGAFEVIAPKRIKNHQILKFIKENLAWMVANQREVQLPDSLLYQGQPLKINLKFGHSGEWLHNFVLCLGLPLHLKITNLESEIKNRMLKWYNQEARRIIEISIQRYCPELGRWPTSWALKQQKTRWGSCGVQNKIYINWLLVMAPPGVLEYVVVHELCHLVHRNHSKRFWEKVEHCMPEYRSHERWLKVHGNQLLLQNIDKMFVL